MKTLKILIFVPIVNICLIFYWLFYKAKKLNTSSFVIKRWLLIIFIGVFVIVGLTSLLYLIKSNMVVGIVLSVQIYLIGLYIGYICYKAIKTWQKEKQN